MRQNSLPRASQDVLSIPADKMSATIHGLLVNRRFSVLVQEIHRERTSPDPEARHKAVLALRHLGFPD